MAATINVIPTASASKATASSREIATFSLAGGVGRAAMFTLLGMIALAIAAYWEVLQETSLAWSQPQYSHGWIIPLIALYILWCRRPQAKSLSPSQAQAIDYCQKAAMATAGLMVVGKMMDISWLAGVGLSGLCLAWLAAGLVGQPYGEASTEEQDANYAPLWVVTGVGSLLVLIGLADLVGVRVVPGLHPGYLQIFGLMVLLLGGIGAAMLTELGPRSGVAEIVCWSLVVALSVASWCYAVPVDMMPLARFSFVTLLCGLLGMVGGLRLVKWAGPAVAFLLFMFPLPTIVEGKMLGVLQKVAVRGSEALYTILGTNVVRSGNRLDIEGVPMNVAEACSGLSMSTILIAMAIAMVLLINRPWWDKLIILLSAAPIAILANVFRIVTTGYIWVVMDRFMDTTDETMHAYQTLTHDYAGIILMMPFALGLYWLELKLLSMLTVQEQGLESQAGSMLGRPGASGSAAQAPR